MNLTRANKLFLMDPWWNDAVEAQAIDRVHRFGQERAVEITRFFVVGSLMMESKEPSLTTEILLIMQKDSIEDRMQAIKQRKSAIIKAAAGGGQQSESIGQDDIEAIFQL